MKKRSRMKIVILIALLIFASSAQDSLACTEDSVLTLFMNGQRLTSNTIDIKNDSVRIAVNGVWVDELSYNWRTNNPSVVKIGPRGEVIPCGVGSAVITAESVKAISITGPGHSYGSCTITITRQGNQNAGNEVILAKGQNYQTDYRLSNLKITGSSIEWLSNYPDIASVSSDGAIATKFVGKATITAKCYMTVSSTAPVNTSWAAIQYPAYSMDVSNDIVLYSSDNTIISPIESTISAIGEGIAFILTKCDVSVIDPYVELNQTTLLVFEGNMRQLTEIIYPQTAVNKNVTWQSSNTSIATVDANGIVTGVKPGNCSVTVKTVDGNKTATCNVIVLAQMSLNSIKEFDVEKGNAYTIAVTAENISSFGTYEFKIMYDPNKLTPANLDALASQNISVVSQSAGEIVFRSERGVVGDRKFSGVVGLFTFKAISSGTTTIGISTI